MTKIHRSLGCAWLLMAAAAGGAHAQPAPTPAAPVSDVEKARAEAQGLVTEGVGFLERDPAAALDRFRRAYAVFPSPKVLINSAAALRKLNKLADAANVYQRYLDDPGADSARRAEVQGFLAEFDATLGVVAVSGLPVGAEVQIDGAPAPWLPSTDTGWLAPPHVTRWRVGPGPFTVRARKVGFVAAQQTGTVTAGATAAVAFTLVEEPKVVTPPTDPGVGKPPPGGDPDDGLDDVIPPATPAAKGTQLGASLDLAIDGKGEGVAVIPGLTLRLGSRLELAARALLGGSKGAYLGATAYLLTGKLRPQLSLGAPIFFSDGARIGLRGGAGLCVDVVPKLSVVAEVGGEYFVNPEMDRFDFVLVPIVGLHARL